MSDSTEHKPKLSREKLEARVVAMLLGEASPFEEEQLREQLKIDADLAKFSVGIEQMLPLLNEAFDVAQASKTKAPRARLDRKRLAKLKQLFRSDPGLSKGRVVRVSFRKAMAIAAAFCAVLLVSSAVLLPSLRSTKARYDMAANTGATPVESEEESRVMDLASAGGLQIADEKSPAPRTAPSSESAPSFSPDRLRGKGDNLVVETVETRDSVVLYDESVEEPEPVSAEALHLNAASGVAPELELELGTAVANWAFGRSKLVGGHNRHSTAPKRELDDLALPKDVGEPAGAYGYGMFAGFPENADKGRISRELSELKSDALVEIQDSVASLHKNLPQQPVPPPSGPVPGFQNQYAVAESRPASQEADGANLYWFNERSGDESGGQAAVLARESLSAAAESNFATPFPDDASATGGMGGMGMGGGGYGGAYPGDLREGEAMGLGVIVASPVSGGAAAAPVKRSDADAAGEQLFGFDGDQAIKESVKQLGVEATSRYYGRAALEEVKSKTAVVGQALNLSGAGESVRESGSLGRQDEGVQAGLREEEHESLTSTLDESKPLLGMDRVQLLAEGDADKRLETRQPESFGSANGELLRRKGKVAASKKVPTTAKPRTVNRSSRLSLAKVEEKQLVEKLKEVEPPAKPTTPLVLYAPRPETATAKNNFSTFSLNVSDVSFKIALASLQVDKLPAPGDMRSEEFLNAFEYRDPMPRAGEPLTFHWERARSPFGHDRDFIRFSVRTAALGRQPGRAVNLVCLLDNSGSMEREDRVSIVRQSLGVLARKLTGVDRVSLVTFSRTPQLRIDGMRGGSGEAFLKAATGWLPQGGTHIEKALSLAYETAKKHFIPGGNNRVILLTDGAANMGNVDPYQLRKTVESHRKQGIALDCFGIGWEGYNDNLLEVLARNGDGRYGFLGQAEQAVAEFEQKLLGAFQVAASDVKVQVEWNAKRVKVYRQVGYLRHQLKKEDFRNNQIDAAEISAAESGNALYVVQVNPDGEGALGVVRVRYKMPFSGEYRELEWSLPHELAATPLEQASPAMRLGSVAATFAEWLARNPHAQGVQLADLQGLLSGIPSIYATDPRPAQLEWMINKARIFAGN